MTMILGHGGWLHPRSAQGDQPKTQREGTWAQTGHNDDDNDNDDDHSDDDR